MQNSIFNILGPIMIGPSSSHTAGAQRLGRAGYMLSNRDISSVKFFLHGSFAKTYLGHGTDKALIGGILGLQSWDDNIKLSLSIAKEKGILFEFIEKDLGDVHPNTVLLEIAKSSGESLSLIGSSIGGGAIEILNINGLACSVSCVYPVIIVSHLDKIGMISTITKILSENNINIVSVKNKRSAKGELANTVIETDDIISAQALEELQLISDVLKIQTMDKL